MSDEPYRRIRVLRRTEGQLTDQPTKLYDQRKDLIGWRRPTAICGVSEEGSNREGRVRAENGRQNANSGLDRPQRVLGRFGPNRRSNHLQHTQRGYSHAAAAAPRPRSAHSPTQTQRAVPTGPTPRCGGGAKYVQWAYGDRTEWSATTVWTNKDV